MDWCYSTKRQFFILKFLCVKKNIYKIKLISFVFVEVEKKQFADQHVLLQIVRACHSFVIYQDLPSR